MEGLRLSQAWVAQQVPEDGLPGGPAETASEENDRPAPLESVT